MQTPFYSSGFLYNPKTHKILLSGQKDNADSFWSMLGGEGHEGENAQGAFVRIVSNLLNLNLKEKNIYPVYDYFHEARNKVNYVFYAEVRNSRGFDSLNNDAYCWVDFSQVSKLLFTARTKQDVIVGERVINAKWREDEARQSSIELTPVI